MATTPGHADATQKGVARRRPVVVMLVVPTYSEVLRELSAARPGSTLALICETEQGLANMEATFRSFRGRLNILKAGHDVRDQLTRIDQEADLILVTRAAVQLGAIDGFSRRERVREFSGEFDNAGLELLGHAIGSVLAERARLPGAVPVSYACRASILAVRPRVAACSVQGPMAARAALRRRLTRSRGVQRCGGRSPPRARRPVPARHRAG